MEGVISAIQFLGFSREFAVNILTELLFLVPFSIFVPMITVVFQQRRGRQRAKKLLPRVEEAADRAIIRFVQIGLHSSALRELKPNQADEINRRQTLLKKAVEDVRKLIDRYNSLMTQVGVALPQRDFDVLWEVSQGLEKLDIQANNIAAFMSRTDDSPEQAGTKVFNIWMNALNASVKSLLTRYSSLRKSGKDALPLSLENFARVIAAITDRKGLDRNLIGQIVGEQRESDRNRSKAA